MPEAEHRGRRLAEHQLDVLVSDRVYPIVGQHRGNGKFNRPGLKIGRPELPPVDLRRHRLFLQDNKDNVRVLIL